MAAASLCVPALFGHLAACARRWAGVAAVLAVTLLGWAVVMQQHGSLWQRLPPGAMQRFVPDGVRVALPARLAAHDLAVVCADSPPLRWARGGVQQALVACSNEPALLAQGDAAVQAMAALEARISDQLRAARTWVAEYEARSGEIEAALQQDLQRARQAPWGAGSIVQRLLAPWPDASTATRQDVGRVVPENRAAAQLRERIEATQDRLETLAKAPPTDRLRGLALLAGGLQLVHDHGQWPPGARLEVDRGSLAEALHRQRTAQGFVQRGFKLHELRVVPQAMATSALVLLAVVLLTRRGRVVPLALWAAASVLLGAGSVVLADLSLTGPEPMRYLAERQFVRFAAGGAAVNLIAWLPLGGGQRIAFWWPLLAVALALACLALLREGRSVWLAPARAWVACAAHPRWGALPALLLLAAGVAVVLLLGMPAAVSELLIALGVVGLATCLARAAPLANLGGGLLPSDLGVVLVALGCAVGGALFRGDLGHALVALMLAAAFAWLFGWAWLRWGVAVLVLAVAAALGLCLVAGSLVGPLAWITENGLPPHAQDRLLAQFDPYHAAASDMARVRWLITSAGLEGWGVGYVPWQGLAPGRVHDGLPLQGPSDYVLALASALWGRAGGLALLAAALLLFAGAAAVGLRTALALAMPPAVRWLAAAGGFGCMVMAFKVVLSAGGVSGVLPLTGLPVALVGYGPVTLAAALLYLLLALGTAHVQPRERSRGVNVVPRRAPPGAARRRGAALALAGAAGIALLIVMGERHLRGAVGEGDHHLARARMQLAQQLANAMLPADSAPGPSATLPCPELGGAIDAWNLGLAALARPVRLGASGAAPTAAALRLEPARLLAQLPVQDVTSCRRLARTLGQMIGSDLPRLVSQPGGSAHRTSSAKGARLSAFEKPRALGARPSDYTTHNAWWGLPGCVQQAGATAAACSRADAPGIPAPQWQQRWLTDVWLQRELAPRLHLALRQPAGEQRINHRQVPTGPALGVTLDATLQPLAQRVADCYTGRLQGADCATVLPRDPKVDDLYFSGHGAIRAGALGLVLVAVESGRIAALAGALSDCSLDSLGRTAQADAMGRLPALRPTQRCAQLPDRRSAWLALQHPALWMVAPGSSLKELAVLAAADAGVLPADQDETWKRILAESRERLPIQRLALASGQRYLDVLSAVGFGTGTMDLLWGGAAQNVKAGSVGPHWLVEAYLGADGLRPTRMTLEEAERVRRQKEAGLNVDKRYGRAAMAEFLAARQLADASVGGGDIRVNALGLAALWRSLDLRSRGRDQAQPVHLLEQPDRVPAEQALTCATPAAARRALALTTGVTASAWKGTAQGSCRVVFGACPAQGLPGLSGKTGSSDFLLEEDSPWVKPGQQMPGKLFGGVFTAGDGKRYAVAAIALRVRQGASATLELRSSAAAEAALTLMREMGVHASAN